MPNFVVLGWRYNAVVYQRGINHQSQRPDRLKLARKIAARTKPQSSGTAFIPCSSRPWSILASGLLLTHCVKRASASLAPLSLIVLPGLIRGRATAIKVISMDAPPNCEQVCRSHPIQFAVPILADDREVFTRRLYLCARKPKLSFPKSN